MNPRPRSAFSGLGRQPLVWLCLALLAATLAMLPVSSAQAVDQVPFSVTIRHINCLSDCDEDGLESTLENTPDFYVKVWINGVKLPLPSDADEPSSPRIDDDDVIDPFWTITGMIPADLADVPVGIQVWDYDSTSGDDLADSSPNDNDNNLDFVVHRATGTYSGDLTSPRSCADGDGGSDDEPPVRLCVDLGGDSDGDGLLDSWEQNGYDDNGDGVVDVDLPALGADPAHKDLFLEVDYDNMVVPDRAGIQAMRDAFAAAPLDVGARAGDREAAGSSGSNDDTFGVSMPPNPDGTRGITLHVDTGALVDPAAREGQVGGTCRDGADNGTDGKADGADPDCIFLDSSVEDPQPGTCTNGTDNDGDGLVDAADPDCLVGDPEFAVAGRGQGQLVASPGPCGVDSSFYAMKNSAQGQVPARRYLFRYALSVQQGACPRPSGGQAEIGGNDLAVFNAGAANYAGTLMHELGHTLNLHHGGFEDNNCKPNYVSVMNYDLQSGIPRVSGGSILDYSPARTNLDGTGHRADVGKLDEEDLNENGALDASDPVNRTVFTNNAGTKVNQSLYYDYVNWNGDTDDFYPGGGDTGVEGNIDTSGSDGNPKACTNDDTDDEVEPANDWLYVSLSFHGFGDASDGAIRPEENTVPTSQELASMRQELNRTDLVISQTDSPDPVAAGTSVTYSVTVENVGPNPADSVAVVDTLPAEVTYSSSSVPCARVAQVLTCQLGSMEAGTERSFTVTASVPANLVYDRGGPISITNTATAVNALGPDSDPSDNSSTEQTRVIAVADLSITGATTTSPLEVLIGQTGSAGLSATVANGGPSSPIDAVLTTTATADPGLTVVPASSTAAVDALAVGSPRAVGYSATVRCDGPGAKTVTLTTTVSTKNAVDIDPDPTNNSRTVQFTVDCVVPIVINVRPGGTPNSINLNTDATLAALTTAAGEYSLPLAFDATRIDVTRTLWGLRSRLLNVATPAGASEIHRQIHPQDSYELNEKTRDGDLDAVMHFKPSASGLKVGNTEACLKGKYRAPSGAVYTFFGCDTVRVLKN